MASAVDSLAIGQAAIGFIPFGEHDTQESLARPSMRESPARPTGRQPKKLLPVPSPAARNAGWQRWKVDQLTTDLQIIADAKRPHGFMDCRAISVMLPTDAPKPGPNGNYYSPSWALPTVGLRKRMKEVVYLIPDGSHRRYQERSGRVAILTCSPASLALPRNSVGCVIERSSVRRSHGTMFLKQRKDSFR